MTVNDLAANLVLVLPVAVLMGWACLLLLVDLWIPKDRKGLTAALAATGLLLALVLSISQVGHYTSAFDGMVIVDGFGVFFSVLFTGSGLLGIALAYDYLKRMGIERGEYYVLLLFSIGGMILMALAGDLIIVFLALEWLSIPLYVLSGFARSQLDSEESALKYFLLGAFSGSFVVFGIALVFGATGTTGLAGILAAVNAGSANTALLTIGAALILIGIGFKVSAVPFHMWTPDVYQGAPSAVTAFMAVGAKAGGFAALLRVFTVAFPALSLDMTPILWALAALTMILGNFVAIAQTNIKRMLAYSSIAHAGYILMAAVPFGQQGVSRDAVASALFYLLAYALTNFAAWSVVIAMEKAEGRDEIGREAGLSLSDYAGLGRKYPALGVVMAVAMLSFTGVPPTLGFVGKFYLFRSVLEAGFVGLALIGVLTSLVSAYYYLRVVVIMFMQDGEPVVRRDPWLYLTAGSAALAVVVLSIFASPLFSWASQAVLQIF
jgi:NADH-quinone oxidoreductase subunit N